MDEVDDSNGTNEQIFKPAFEAEPQGTYSETLKEDFEARRVSVVYADRRGPVDISPQSDLKLDFSATVDGVPHDVVSLISVTGYNAHGVGPMYGAAGIEASIQNARAGFALVREPQSGGLQVLTLSPEELAAGEVTVGSADGWLTPVGEGKPPVSGNIVVGDTEWEQCGIRIWHNGGSSSYSVMMYNVANVGAVLPMAMVVEPLPESASQPR